METLREEYQTSSGEQAVFFITSAHSCLWVVEFAGNFHETFKNVAQTFSKHFEPFTKRLTPNERSATPLCMSGLAKDCAKSPVYDLCFKLVAMATKRLSLGVDMLSPCQVYVDRKSHGLI